MISSLYILPLFRAILTFERLFGISLVLSSPLQKTEIKKANILLHKSSCQTSSEWDLINSSKPRHTHRHQHYNSLNAPGTGSQLFMNLGYIGFSHLLHLTGNDIGKKILNYTPPKIKEHVKK